MKKSLAIVLVALAAAGADAATVLTVDSGEDTVRQTNTYAIATRGTAQVVRIAPAAERPPEPRRVLQIRQHLGQSISL